MQKRKTYLKICDGAVKIDKEIVDSYMKQTKEQIEAETIDKCVNVMHDYYKDYVEVLPKNVDMELLKLVAIVPQRELHRLLIGLKE